MQATRPTRDSRGVFVPDTSGKRPGIYTYLSGEPNNWSSATVDHNLRTEESRDLVASAFDPHSIMLYRPYRFPDSFYKTVPSACQPVGDGQELSDEDIRGLQLLYPDQLASVDTRVQKQNELVEALGQSSSAASLESIQNESTQGNPDGLETLRNILQRNLESVAKK